MHQCPSCPTLAVSCQTLTAGCTTIHQHCACRSGQGEVKLLLELLPRYCEHVEKHPHTLLIKFYGLHRVRPLKGAKVLPPGPSARVASALLTQLLVCIQSFQLLLCIQPIVDQAAGYGQLVAAALCACLSQGPEADQCCPAVCAAVGTHLLNGAALFLSLDSQSWDLYIIWKRELS